jgi:hypothetical protein
LQDVLLICGENYLEEKGRELKLREKSGGNGAVFGKSRGVFWPPARS